MHKTFKNLPRPHQHIHAHVLMHICAHFQKLSSEVSKKRKEVISMAAAGKVRRVGVSVKKKSQIKIAAPAPKKAPSGSKTQSKKKTAAKKPSQKKVAPKKSTQKRKQSKKEVDVFAFVPDDKDSGDSDTEAVKERVVKPQKARKAWYVESEEGREEGKRGYCVCIRTVLPQILQCSSLSRIATQAPSLLYAVSSVSISPLSSKACTKWIRLPSRS